jgi:hypothetical protein
VVFLIFTDKKTEESITISWLTFIFSTEIHPFTFQSFNKYRLCITFQIPLKCYLLVGDAAKFTVC